MIYQKTSPVGSEAFVCLEDIIHNKFIIKRYFVLDWNDGWVSLGVSKKRNTFDANYRPNESFNVFPTALEAGKYYLDLNKLLAGKEISEKQKELNKAIKHLAKLNTLDPSKFKVESYPADYDRIDI